ncbi:MAG: ABC transporter permease [Opitutales bacterium]|nr:ABC transporter permease [Opitutales bacterium]
MKKHNKPYVEWLLTLPSLGWLTLFFIIPTIIVFAIAFKPAGVNGGIGEGWTLESIRNLAQPSYPEIIFRTIWISVVATAVCLFLSTPVAYWLALQPPQRRQWLMLLIILPFWTNFLIRIFAWKTLLHSEGWLKYALVSLGLVSPDAILLYNSGAILVVLIYTYLPFAILPIYAAAEKFDFSLIDAAHDLGASRIHAFFSIFVPGIRTGLFTALMVVLIPALGSYAIPDIVGGASSEMIGNKIAQRTFVDRNLPHASALSACLALAVLIPMMISLIGRDRRFTKKTGGKKA